MTEASLVASVTNDQGHRDLAASLEGRGPAWVKFTKSDGSTGFSSAIQISKRELIITGHQLIDSYGNAITIDFAGNSLNYNNPSVGQVAPVILSSVHPDYNYQNPWGTPDIALIRVGSDLNWNLGESLQFAAMPPLGTTLMGIGVGIFGDPSVGLVGQSGDMRAFYSRSISAEPYDGGLYGAMSGNRTSLGIYRGQGWGGDSGGIIGYYDSNQSFRIVGTMSQASLNSTASISLTYFTRLDAQADWLESVLEAEANTPPKLVAVSIHPPAANQPPKFTGTVANGPPGGTARLQASLDLGTTDPWADLSSVVLDAEGSATFTNIPDSRPQALDALSDYFRVVTAPPSVP